jgi:osmoprotectant transport system substrate-binding protein
MDRQVDLAVGSATDAQIERLSLTMLRDDRSYFPAYEAAPIVRQTALDAHPALADALRRLAGSVSVAAMRRANNRVDGEHASPAEAARELISSIKPAGRE